MTTTSDRDTNNDNGLVSKVIYDGFGRTTETQRYEGGTNYIRTEQLYDALDSRELSAGSPQARRLFS